MREEDEDETERILIKDLKKNVPLRVAPPQASSRKEEPCPTRAASASAPPPPCGQISGHVARTPHPGRFWRLGPSLGAAFLQIKRLDGENVGSGS